MKGDFSRIRFNAKKQYTAVLEQQGRVSLDADANEQCAIDGYLSSTETVDVIGEYGAPANDAGFAITVSGNEILIGAGRYYVEGLMCENKQNNLAYGDQPYLLNPSPTDSMMLKALAQHGGVIQVFLQVWQRLVTAMDDPCLREPALGQADTTARLQTVWRVVANLVQRRVIAQARTALAAERKVASAPTERLTTKVFASAVKENLTFSHLDASAGTVTAAAPAAAPLAAASSDCCAQMYDQPVPARTGVMGSMTSGGTTDCSCQPIAAAGYRGLENQLYRIEIHQPGDATKATFKWSRENGSVVAAILSISGPTVWVDSLGPDANLGFQPNDWVEISDDTYLFGQKPNQPGMLYQILSVDPTGPSITLTTPAVSVDPTRNARLRRWDQSGSSAGSNGIPLAANTWQTLENGILVSFGSGIYQTGDYWLIPARAASGQIDWPPCGSNGNLFQSPNYVAVFNAPLACIQWDAKNRKATVEDCRRIFSPLTDLTPSVTPPALHIKNYSWLNDDITTFDALLKSGLTLTLDAAPTGPISGANFIVTIEAMDISLIRPEFAAVATHAASPASAASPAGTATTPAQSAATNRVLNAPSTSPYTAVYQVLPLSISILDWQTTVNTSTKQIVWGLPKTELTGLQFRFLQLINNLLGTLADFGLYARARVKLVGHTIFAQSGNAQNFLDGQSFGQQTTRQDGKTPCISLQMPSGNGNKASDFEGWFYLAPFNSVSSLTMNYPAFTVVLSFHGDVIGVNAGTPPARVTAQVTVHLRYPGVMVGGTTVSLALSAVTAGVTAGNYVGLAITSLVIPQGSDSATVNIDVFGSPGLNNSGAGNTYTFQITASVELAYGTSEPQSVTFTLTGAPTPIG